MDSQSGMYTTTSGGHPMSAPSERESVVKEFEWAITDLQKVVAELDLRLQPVLRPLGPENDSGNPMPHTSDVRARLHDLHATTGVLRALLERLEV